MKAKAAALLFLTAFWLMPHLAKAEVIERIVAVVGDEIVLLSELQDALETIRPAIEEQAKKVPAADRDRWIEAQAQAQIPQLLDLLIRERLVMSEAKKLRLTVTDEEVDNAVAQVAKRQAVDPAGFRRLLKEQGYEWDAYRDEWRRALLRGKIEQRVLAGRVQITDSDEQAYYNQHYAAGGPERVHLRLIFLAVADDKSDRAAVGKKAAGLLARIRKGEPFEKMARQYTQGPNAAAGGDVGFLERGQMLPAVEDVAFSIKSGSVSDVISTERGFFILQVVERQGIETPPFEKVQQEIREKLWSERMTAAFDSWVADLERTIPIDRRL